MKVKDEVDFEDNTKVKVKHESDTKASSREIIIVKKQSQNVGKQLLLKHLTNAKGIFTWSNATPIQNQSDAGYTCCYCDSVYEDPAELKKHTRANHIGIKDSRIESYRLEEFCVKTDITDLHCNICLEAIDTIDTLIKHLNEVHNKGLFTEINNQFIPFKFDSNKLQCCICSVQFEKFKLLLEHMNKHSRNFVCSSCDAGFITRRQFTVHVGYHHKKGKYSCSLCSEDFSTTAKKLNHMRYVHRPLVNKCQMCNELFKDYQQKIRHMREAHNVINTVKCSACDRTFKTRKSCTVHMKKQHLMERTHKCVICDKSFFQSSGLKRHMKVHTGEKSFQCDICLKRYGQKHTLKEHMRIHADDRRFKCDYCGKTFVQKCSWRGHMRTKHGQEC